MFVSACAAGDADADPFSMLPASAEWRLSLFDLLL